MNRKQLFKNLAHYGNKNIVYLTTRTLFPDEEELKIKIDSLRLKDELELYKYSREKGNPSIISSLTPLIIANPNMEKAIREAQNLYSLIRKKLDDNNKAGITLLAYYIYNLLEEAPEFSQLNLVDETKEAEVIFQKTKIRLILNSIEIEELIAELLEENDIEFNTKLLSSLKEENNLAEEYLELMASYFQKVSLFQIKSKPYNQILNIQDIFKMSAGAKGKAGIIGEFEILEKDEESKAIKIVISAKMGILKLETKKP